MYSGGNKSVMGFKKHKRRFQYNELRSERWYQISIDITGRIFVWSTNSILRFLILLSTGLVQYLLKMALVLCITHHSPCFCRELGKFPHCVRNIRTSLVLWWLLEEADNAVGPEIINLIPHWISRLFYWSKQHQWAVFKLVCPHVQWCCRMYYLCFIKISVAPVAMGWFEVSEFLVF